MKTIVIIGAGITGLSAAFFYHKKFPTHRTILLDANEKAGGNIQSFSSDGFIFENGPRGILPTHHEVLHLIHQSGAWELLKPSSRHGSKRLIFAEGNLHHVSPIKIITDSYLRPIISAVWNERAPSFSQVNDETVTSFFSRRLGKRVTETLVSAFVTGIWAGNINELSARSTFPILVEWEKKYGSILRGLLKTKVERREKRDYLIKKFAHPETGKIKLFSMEKGLQQLTNYLTQQSGIEFFGSQKVNVIEQVSGQWKVATENNEFMTDEVLFATPAFVTSQLVSTISLPLSNLLGNIDYAPVTVIHLGWQFLPHRPEGFGFLLPASENSRVLGVIFNSGSFPDTAPEGGVNLTVLMGGARFPNVVEEDEETLIQEALLIIRKALKISQMPTIIKVKHWDKAIPQYKVGHEELIDQLMNEKNKIEHVHMLGNWMGGVGLNDCVKNAHAWVEKLSI